MNSTKRIFNVNITRLPKDKLRYKKIQKHDLPSSVDLRSKCPPIFDQGHLGSCTANALCGIFDYEDKNAWVPSRLFVYYNERQMEGSVGEDAGASLQDGIKTLEKYGVCPETMWPYDISKFTVKPSGECYNVAIQNRALAVTNIPDDEISMKTSLVSGTPFAVGIAVYESFEAPTVATTGVVPMPDTKREKCVGGHAVVVVGYNDESKTWLMRNSWGANWGMDGYFTLPYKYLLDPDLSSDFWNITKLTDYVPTSSQIPFRPIYSSSSTQNKKDLETLREDISSIRTDLAEIKAILKDAHVSSLSEETKTNPKKSWFF